LPGAGNVRCDKSAGAGVGRCRNSMGCTPQAGICHFKDSVCSDTSTSAPNNCCNYLGSSSNCELDALFVPRCNALPECRDDGEDCASSADCCEGTLCLPDETGRLRCDDPPGDDPCVPKGSRCTSHGDCCAGTVCIIAPGAGSGTCGTSDPPTGAGGMGGGPGGDGGNGGTGTCAEYGQSCGAGVPCCNADDVPCSAGICRIDPQ
jgi:hypothetical protein